MREKLDIENWNRKDHFHFFNQFDEPFFGVTVEMDCTKTVAESEAEGVSFFLKYLHKSLAAANEIDAFKLRIEGEEVYKYDLINASPTIARENGTFGFSYINYHQDFSVFRKNAEEEIKIVKAGTGLFPATSGENVIHYSSLPWVKFTALSHARNYKFQDSCPKIVFGKTTELNKRMIIPMSVHLHHALADGIDIGLYVEALQKTL